MSGFTIADHLLVPSLPSASLVSLNNDDHPSQVNLLKPYKDKSQGDTNPDVVSNFTNRLLKTDDPFGKSSTITSAFHTSSYARSVVKNNSRDANPFMHEWFPCNTWHLQLKWDLAAIEQKLASRPIWQSLHQIMRTPTRGVIFKPTVASKQVTVTDAKQCGYFKAAEITSGGVLVRPVKDGETLIMLQGHPGGISGGHKATYHPGTQRATRSGHTVPPSITYDRTWQTLGSDEFHDQCFGTMIGSAVYFLSQPERYYQLFQAIQSKLQRVHAAWCWDGATTSGMKFLLPFEGWTGTTDEVRVPLVVDDANSFQQWQRQLGDDYRATVLKMGQIADLARAMITGQSMSVGVKFF